MYLDFLPFKTVAIVAVFMSSVLHGCDKPDPEHISGKELDLTGAEIEIVSRSNDFAFKLYGESLDGLGSRNALISPLSIQAALAMTYQGARGDTRDAIANAIGVNGLAVETVNAYFKKLINDLPQLDPQTKLEVANSIWYRQGFEVIPAFLDVNRTYFNAEVNALDFNADSSVERINDWVKTKTHDKIEKIVNQLEADLMMLLLNAVYFKGGWEQQFDNALTARDVFHHGTDAAHVLHADYMRLEHTFPVAGHAKFDAIELPYGNKKFSMVALRPKDGVTVADLVETFSGTGQWAALLNESSFSPRKIKLHFPKFKFSYSNKLNDELAALGMTTAFSPTADFTGINLQGQLRISEVRHKSFIEVNEEGTEATAVTSVGIVLTSVPVVPVMKFDRPFLFVIRESSSGLIMFVGQVNDPTSETTEL